MTAQKVSRPSAVPTPKTPHFEEPELLFANGFGGFTRDGREYVVTLAGDGKARFHVGEERGVGLGREIAGAGGDSGDGTLEFLGGFYNTPMKRLVEMPDFSEESIPVLPGSPARG